MKLLYVFLFISGFITISCSQPGREYVKSGIEKRNSGDFKGAIEDFNKAIELNPRNQEAYFNRASARGSASGDFIGAIEDYTKAIELDPQYKEAYDSRGWHKHLLSDYRGAIVDYTKAIEIDPESKMSLGIYSRRALSKERLDDYRGAIADYNKIIEINPQNIRGYYNRGWAKLELGDIHGGCLDWSKAGELGDFDAYEMIRKYCN